MNKVYASIAEKGGWTGYGVLGIPHVGGMNSIDNHYLLVHLAWGRLGYILFVLIVWENIRALWCVHGSSKLRRTVPSFSLCWPRWRFSGSCSDGLYGGTAAADRFSPGRLDTIDSRRENCERSR